MLRKDDGPPLPSVTLLSEHSVVRKLWRRVRRDGAQIDATLWWSNALGQAVVEIEVRSAYATDTLAESLAEGVLRGLDADGAQEPDE
jgi:hypothetical protein